ncbi:formylglycine-generating enzyme family protein [Okeania sp. KiyG1]|uniref:formylglycine-generating enzyme family protein n=1 Tax=Okeania sp. KiyG1 TaxID=2720165 RepID=UPI0019CAD0DC|nr:formylglycine-generating enzyme family protein [Okeania sp. KiyG1]GGA12071.1 hypothetical protein CYANOKiyG1_25160 [Okeania sp. KiyG1]
MTIDDSLSFQTNEQITPILSNEIPTLTTPIYPDITTDNTKQKRYSEHNLPLRIPDAPSIPKPLEFAKALRPLMQKVSSGRNTILDEIETVEQTAINNGICIPILKSEPEPWLDLVLVVDEYKSMTLWQHTIRELKQLLKHYGIFREVKICGLTYQLAISEEQNNFLKREENQEKILLSLGVGKQQYFANPQELIDTTGRRLILIVSDCIAPFWHDGSILSILREWVKYQPLAIVQMLPDWMWRRTGLRIGSSVQFKNLVPGNSNQNLIIKELLLWKNMPLEQGIKIPVLTLEPKLAEAWSQMVVSKPDALASGFVLPNQFQAKSENLPQNKVEQLNAEKRVNRFRKNASPVARKLASLLSAAPTICLPVVRIIQAGFLPQGQPIHIAEVFLGGLLKPMIEITPDTNSEQVEYQFVDEEIRQILLKDAPVSDSQQVFDAVSQYVEKHFGKSIKDFVALLKSPGNDGEDVPPFAEIAFDILKQLGGDYTAFVEEVENSGSRGTQLPTPNYEFEANIATIVFEDEEEKLQQWEFQTPTVNRRGEIIKRTTHTAFYFTETLGDKVGLEMVAIPGGTFTMGSSESEKGSRDNERPQHDVTVPPFFMGKYPVTQGQWRAIASRKDLKVNLDLNPDPSKFKEPCKGINRWQRPVEQVNWYEAVEFCERLSKLTGRNYRLPSEAEWEYACRAGTTTPFYFGETITGEFANYRASETYGDEQKGEYKQETIPVDQFPPNVFGLYDMHGNVWEWCADDWHDNYENAPTDGNTWVDSNDKKELYSVLRGGSWFNLPNICRSAYRLIFLRRDLHYDLIGFRIVCSDGSE